MAGVASVAAAGLTTVQLQGAYGILCEVESHPFATDAMLFMDWRDGHTSSDPEMQESNRYKHRDTNGWELTDYAQAEVLRA